jgi:hypothetical protein
MAGGKVVDSGVRLYCARRAGPPRRNESAPGPVHKLSIQSRILARRLLTASQLLLSISLVELEMARHSASIRITSDLMRWQGRSIYRQ